MKWKLGKYCCITLLFLLASIYFSPVDIRTESEPKIKNSPQIFSQPEPKIPQSAWREEWTSNDIPISATADAYIASYYKEIKIINDGAGGAILVWQDRRNTNYDIYCQKVNASGSVKWTTDGVACCTQGSDQRFPELCPDGTGGAIITWEDWRVSDMDKNIYAQRINGTGNVMWTSNGVAICTQAQNQLYPKICSDGSGGAFIVWLDWRSGTGIDIYAQRINSAGVVQWAANGLPVYTLNDADRFSIVSNGANSVIVTWTDSRTDGGDIYAQRLNLAGTRQWNVNGVPICTRTGLQNQVQLCEDDMGGAIITWKDNNDVFAQRVNSTGNVNWTVDGEPIVQLGSTQYNPKICRDGENGAYITWEDNRNGDYDIYVQRINNTGEIQWTTNGVLVSGASSNQYWANPSVDDAGGVFVAFHSFQDGTAHIFIQHFDSEGSPSWITDGVRISTSLGGQVFAEICSYGSSCITGWADYRTDGNGDIYAQCFTQDIKSLNVTIQIPEADQLIGANPPSFEVYVSEPHLHKLWYTIDDGLHNYTFTMNETINQNAWNSHSDGLVTIRFYANDTFKNENHTEVNVEKDGTAPIINVIAPVASTVFNATAPNFTVEIEDIRLDTMWYTIDGGLHNYTFNSNGTINQTAWSGQPQGTVVIKFYANDTLGNLRSFSVNVVKYIPVQPGDDDDDSDDDSSDNKGDGTKYPSLKLLPYLFVVIGAGAAVVLGAIFIVKKSKSSKLNKYARRYGATGTFEAYEKKSFEEEMDFSEKKSAVEKPVSLKTEPKETKTEIKKANADIDMQQLWKMAKREKKE